MSRELPPPQRAGGRRPQRQQYRRWGFQQVQRVQVERASKQPPVQAGDRRAVAGYTGEPTYPRAGLHRGADPQRPIDRLVRRPQAAGMVNDHDGATRDPAREADLARTGRQHRLPGCGGEVHPSVTGRPWCRGSAKGREHGGLRGQRPPPQWGGCPGIGRGRAGRCRGCEGGQGRQRGQQNLSNHGANPGRLRPVRPGGPAGLWTVGRTTGSVGALLGRGQGRQPGDRLAEHARPLAEREPDQRPPRLGIVVERRDRHGDHSGEPG